MENRPPLVLRLQIDEILRVAESPGVGSIVGAANLRNDRFDFRKGCKNIALILSEFLAL